MHCTKCCLVTNASLLVNGYFLLIKKYELGWEYTVNMCYDVAVN